MHSLAVAVLLVAVAYTSATTIIAGPAALGVGPSVRGALEGALGGQWIPDGTVVGAAPAVVAAPALAAPLGVGIAAPGIVASRGALEGALGGRWIPDTLGK